MNAWSSRSQQIKPTTTSYQAKSVYMNQRRSSVNQTTVLVVLCVIDRVLVTLLACRFASVELVDDLRSGLVNMRGRETGLTLGLIRFSCSLGKMRSRSQARSRDSKIVRASYEPWPTNSFSKRSKNSRHSLSSGLRASSPTTAFIEAASRAIAYFAYCNMSAAHK